MATPSPKPVRFPNGVSTDYPYGPLADFGQIHPFEYHTISDDFDFLRTEYTATKTGNGTIVTAAGDGGRLVFTTNNATPLAADLASLQMPFAGFQRPAADAGKKLFFLTRLQMADVVAPEVNVGLIQTTATPFTVTDGIYFNKPAGAGNTLSLKSAIGSVITNFPIPVAAYTLANNTDIDLAFYVDRAGIIYAYVNAKLVGWLPNNNQPGVKGPVGSITPAITTAALNATLAIRSGGAASKAMNVDFAMWSKER